MITVELEKEDLINLICGTEPSARTCCDLAKINYMRDTGNGWNCGWEWRRDALAAHDETRLFLLYKVVTGKIKDQNHNENVINFNTK
jgi:hypothetical protein